MSDADEERTLIRQRAAVVDHSICVHLQEVVVVEAQRFMLYYTPVELEPRGLQALAAARMAAVKDGHIVLLRHLVDGIEQAEEILLGVDILLAVSTQMPRIITLSPRIPIHQDNRS